MKISGVLAALAVAMAGVAAPALAQVANSPRTALPGTTLDKAAINQVVAWVGKAYAFEHTPFCYRHTYDRGVGILPRKLGTHECHSDRHYSNGLCYLHPRNGYQCEVTMCQQQCPSPLEACGPGACAESKRTCAAGVTDMVAAVGSILANVGTDGAAESATQAAKAAKEAELATKAAKAAEAADKLNTAAQLLNTAMTQAETGMVSLAGAHINGMLAAKFGQGSPNYRTIAREWSIVRIRMIAGASAQAIDDLVESSVDPSGVVGAIQAFNQPKCNEYPAPPF